MKTHAGIKALLAHYDYLPPRERAEVDAHVVDCAECASELALRAPADAGGEPDALLERAPSIPPPEPLPEPLPAPVPPRANPHTRPARDWPLQAVAAEPERAHKVEDDVAVPRKWQRLLLPLAMALLFVGSLWAGMHGQEAPHRPVDVAPAISIATDTVRNRVLPLPPTEAPLTIDASGHVTITFACDEAVIASPEYRGLARAFKDANRDVTVQLVTWEQARQEWQSRSGNLAGASQSDTIRAIRGGSDVFCATGDDSWLLQEGLVRNLAPLARADTDFAIDQFYPEVLERATDAGALYLIPARFHPMLVRYDQEAFKSARLGQPGPGWSWDDLLSTATALTMRQGTNTRRWGLGQRDGALLLAHFWSAVNTLQFKPGKAGGNPLHNGDVLDLFRWADALYVQSRTTPPLPGSTADNPGSRDYQDQVRRRRFAMWTDELGGPPPAGTRAVPFPVSRAFDKTTPLGPVDGWAISSEAQYVDAAWRWIAFMSQNLPAGDGIGVPARRSVPQLQAFFKKVAPEDREAYQYALEHLGNWPALSDLDGSQQLWITLLSLIRGQTTLAALTAPADAPADKAVEASGIVTITFAAPRDQRAAYERAAADFVEANPSIRIKVVPSEDLLPARSGTEILWNQMRVMAGRVDAMANEQVPQLVRSGRVQGILYDLTPLIAESLRADDYYPNTLEGLRWRGRAFALPGRIGLRLIHYNKWMFDQMDVSYPQPGWTWDDFDLTVRAVALRADSTQSWWGLSEAIGNGLQLLKSRTGPLVDYTTVPPTPQLDRSSVVAATARYAELLADSLLPPGTGWASDAAMWIAPLDLEGLDSLRRAGVGIVPFPIGPGSGATTPLEYYEGLAISAGTPHPQEAWQWLLYLQAYPALDEAHFAGLGARRQAQRGPGMPEDPEVRDAIEFALEHAQRPAPLRPEEYLASEQLSQALSRIVDGGQPAPAALKEAQAAAEKQLSAK